MILNAKMFASIATLIQYGGLNKNVSYRLWYFNIWSPVGDAV